MARGHILFEELSCSIAERCILINGFCSHSKAVIWQGNFSQSSGKGHHKENGSGGPCNCFVRMSNNL